MNENIVTLIKNTKPYTQIFQILELKKLPFALRVHFSKQFQFQMILDKNSISCDRELKYRDFGETFIIFNDLKVFNRDFKKM